MADKRRTRKQKPISILPSFVEKHSPGANFNGRGTRVRDRFSLNYDGKIGTDIPHLPKNLLDKSAINHDIFFFAPDISAQKHANRLYDNFVKEKKVLKTVPENVEQAITKSISYTSNELLKAHSTSILTLQTLRIMFKLFTMSGSAYGVYKNVLNMYKFIQDIIERRNPDYEENVRWQMDEKMADEQLNQMIEEEQKTGAVDFKYQGLNALARERLFREELRSRRWQPIKNLALSVVYLLGSGSAVYYLSRPFVRIKKDAEAIYDIIIEKNKNRPLRVEKEVNKVVEKYDEYLKEIGYFDPQTQDFILYRDADKEKAEKLYIDFYNEWKTYLKYINEEYKDEEGFKPYNIPELNMKNINQVKDFDDKEHAEAEKITIKDAEKYVKETNEAIEKLKETASTITEDPITEPPINTKPIKENDKIISVKDIQDKMVVAEYDSIYSYVDGITAQDRRKEMIDMWREGEKLVQAQGGKDLVLPKWTAGTRGISKSTFQKAYSLLQKQLNQRNIATSSIEKLDDRADDRQMAKVEAVVKNARPDIATKIINSFEASEFKDEEASKALKAEKPKTAIKSQRALGRTEDGKVAELSKIEPVADAPFTTEPIKPPRFEAPEKPKEIQKTATGNRDNPDNLIDTIRATDAVVDAVLKPSAKDIRKRRANLYDFITPSDQNGGIGTRETNPLIRGNCNRFMGVRRGNISMVRENHVLGNTNNLKMLPKYDIKDISKKMKAAREAPRKRRGLVRRFPARFPRQRQTKEERRDFQPSINPPSNYAKGSMYSNFFINRPALPLPYEDYVRLFYGNANEFFDGNDYYNPRTNRWL